MYTMQHARGLYVYCCNSVFRRSAIPQGVVTESNYRTSITYYLHLWIEAYFEMRALALLVFLHAAGGEGKRISSPPIAALQRLRGGGTAYQQQPSYRRYYPAPEPRDTSRQPPALQDGEMSDAERVFVVQQFARQEVRARFLRRVFLIVALQVALTAAVMALVRSTPQLLYTLARASPMVLLAPLAPALMLQLSPSASQRPPLNYLLLAAYTVLQGGALGLATAFLPAELMVRAVSATAVAAGGLSVYALRTKRDFTMRGGLLTSGLLGLLALGLVQALFGGAWINTVRAFVGVLVFSVRRAHSCYHPTPPFRLLRGASPV